VTARLLLGVDGGNTKTVALLARENGTIVGRGLAGCSDIYGATSSSAALEELGRAIRAACAGAGVSLSSIGPTALCLAGADWPEDIAYLACEVRRMGLSPGPVVYNDAFGTLRAGSEDFTGVAIVCGTGTATGARSDSGEIWHTSWWQEPHGARHLGQKALRAVYRAELGIGPETSLTGRTLDIYGAGSIEELLHTATARNHAPFSTEPAARILTAEAESGDPVARAIVRAHGEELGAYGAAAARAVGLSGRSFRLVLGGGVLTSSRVLLEAAIDGVSRAEPRALPVSPTLSPAAGALLLAFDQAGLRPHTSSWGR
jgi:N-acetylglucosamine kinase-like BadF-type ATPase